MPTIYKKQSGSWVKHKTWKKLYKKINGEWIEIGNNIHFAYYNDGYNTHKYDVAQGKEIATIDQDGIMATDRNGNLYIASPIYGENECHLYKYDANTNLIWNIIISSINTNSPLFIEVSKNSEVVLIGRNRMVCVNPDGSIKWSVNVSWSISTDYSIFNIVIYNGAIYVGNAHSPDYFFVRKYNLSNGSQVWNKTFDWSYDEYSFIGVNKSGNILVYASTSSNEYYILTLSNSNASIIKTAQMSSWDIYYGSCVFPGLVDYRPDTDDAFISDARFSSSNLPDFSTISAYLINLSSDNPKEADTLSAGGKVTIRGIYADLYDYVWYPRYNGYDNTKRYELEYQYSPAGGDFAMARVISPSAYTATGHYEIAVNGGRARTMQL